MGVAADSEPIRKRQRLSLKGKRLKKVTQSCDTETPGEDEGNNNAKQSPPGLAEALPKTASASSSETWSSSGTTSSSSGSTISSESSLVSPDNWVPAVASLENLGNTCFMNSMIQILRFTPTFLENLATLYQDILATEKIKRKTKTDTEEEMLSVLDDNLKKCWKVVKTLYRVYRSQTQLEDEYEDVASDDVMSMAIRPRRLLQAVRELNPMYEGHMQHDAQEFLRCLQCYFQDAEKEVQKFYDQLPSKFSPKFTINHALLSLLAQINDVKTVDADSMDAFTGQNTSSAADASELTHEKVKVNLFPKAELKSQAVKSPENITSGPRAGDTASVVDEIRNQTVVPGMNISLESGAEEVSVCAKCCTNDCDIPGHGKGGASVGHKQAAGKAPRARGRGRPRRGRRPKPYDRECSESNIIASQKMISEVEPANKQSDCHQNQSCTNVNTDSILTNRKQTSGDMSHPKTCSTKKKRLGMRGALIRKKTAEQLFDEVKELEMSLEEPRLPDSDANAESMDCELDSVVSAVRKDVMKNGRKKVNKFDNSGNTSLPDGSNVTGNVNDSYFLLRRVPSAMHNTSLAAYQNACTGHSLDDDSEEEEDIVTQKKREKLINESPRRSPRKTASANAASIVNKIKRSQLSLSSDSKRSPKHDIPNSSELSIESVMAKLDFRSDSENKSVTADSKSDSLNIVSTNGEMECSHTASKCGSTVTDKTKVLNSEKLQNKDSSNSAETDVMKSFNNSTNISLLPVVKLENCDHVFQDRSSSVSASYASQCLTPIKHEPRTESSNYLKQKTAMLQEQNKEELKKAIEEMLNSPVKSRSKFDLIERHFQGRMMLRTRCIQCECAWERQEDFHDISVPVRIENDDSDDEGDDIPKPSSTKRGLLDLIEASTEVEKLLDDNRYYCDECKSYTEAERSIHYDILPDILTLHLKIFSAETNNPGSIFKIKDGVDIPLTLPCLKYKCATACLRPDHKYKLYGIVAHSGSSMMSGHYISYVRALPPMSMKTDRHENDINNCEQPQCSINGDQRECNYKAEADQPECSNNSEANKPKCSSIAQANNNFVTQSPTKTDKAATMTRKRAGVATKLPARFTEGIVANTKVKAFEGVVAKKPSKLDIVESIVPTKRYTAEWFQCDDETIRVFEESEFLDTLNGTTGSLLGTPYLLFYHKATMC